MESASEIAHSIGKSHPGCEHVQPDDIAPGRTARHATEMPIDQADS
jgi:hypothetical protein